MNSTDIHKILSRDPYTAKYYLGVFPCDKIPAIEQFPSAMVINTDKHDEKGTHWLAIYIQSNYTLEFFDSYGLPPEAYGKDITKFLKKYPNIRWNKIVMQSLTSNVCGQYCIYFILRRCQGLCMKFIIHQLAGKKNDFRLYQFVKKRYGVNMIFKK
jgi:hypothetical protein